MITTRWCKSVSVAALGLSLAALTGCQTWVAGMTLPSGYYLEHKPQYFRPDPDFPLERELATMQAQDALIAGGGRAAEVPAGAGAAVPPPAVGVPVAPAAPAAPR